MTNNYVGNPLALSHVPNVLLSLTDHMTFWQRMLNTAYTVLWEMLDRMYYLPFQEHLRKQVCASYGKCARYYT